ncbi:Fe-S cluster assembly protein SufD [Sodalis sp. CWE]|uniref:Fe-S cluster assembly protein SufD n=1 Tax=Sodalis sp. CWE TaxID=2803816 RepID=UPI001C7D69CA|nr:Fe-S cluster assembly protein SufD [Sodalis sp. CWE]MBX4181156.1 Fe-S cluster assembly protein SufD [Sodalis sp. CWE]
MVGLLESKISQRKILKQWARLFFDPSIRRSKEAYNHWNNLKKIGLPTRRDEHWKYTPLDKLLSHRFLSAMHREISPDIRDGFSLNLDSYRIVFVNGLFSPVLSDSNTGFWQIKIDKETVHQPLPSPIQSEVFLHLTESLSREIIYIILPEKNIEQRPLYLLHIDYGNEDKEALNTINYRHHIKMEPSSQGQVIEHFVSADSLGHFTGTRTSIEVSGDVHLNHMKLIFENHSSYHVSHNDIVIKHNAIVHSNTFILDTGFTRQQISSQLNGEKSNLVINSLLFSTKKNINDICTYLEHNKKHCLSRQLHKIIVRDQGKGVFSGLIKVAQYATKSDGQMNNRNLLLDHLSEINTRPQLEIYADDVKCSHGSTIGKIDEEQVFYLRSRGIVYKDAQKMIIRAFAEEITETVFYKEIRDIILSRITEVL